MDVPRADEFTKDLSELFKTFNENLQSARKRQKEFVNKYRIEASNFIPGDKMWINSSLIIHNGNKKLKLRKLVPYKIIKKISSFSYKLDLPKNIKIHPIIHGSELESFY